MNVLKIVPLEKILLELEINVKVDVMLQKMENITIKLVIQDIMI